MVYIYVIFFYFVTGDTDLVVIGSGPGGYVAAIKAAQMGMKVIISSFLSSIFVIIIGIPIYGRRL